VFYKLNLGTPIEKGASPTNGDALEKSKRSIGTEPGELLALRWLDIQDGRAVIGRSLTQTKYLLEFKSTMTEDSARRVTLPSSTVTALEVHRRQQEEFRQQFGPDYRAGLDLIFANPDGTPLKPDSVSASVSALCKRLKLPKGASLHTLRHSHGSHLIASGMDLATVSARLGHSNVRVTAKSIRTRSAGGTTRQRKSGTNFSVKIRRRSAPEMCRELSGTDSGASAVPVSVSGIGSANGNRTRRLSV
jgi:hypothetical protein